MANAWLIHVKSTMKQNPKMKFKAVLKKAKHTYKKSPSSKKRVKKARKTRKRGASKKRGRK